MGKKIRIVFVSVLTIFLSYVLGATLFLIFAMSLMNPTPRAREIFLQPRATGRRRGSLSDFTS
jgi:hypothetical protein